MKNNKKLQQMALYIGVCTSIYSCAQEATPCPADQKWGENSIPKNGIGPYVSLEALFWKANQNNLEFAVKNSADTDVQLYIGPESSPHFKYDWGFRLGAGHTFKSHDNWDLYADWTHFNTSAGNTINAGSSLAIQPTLTSAYGGSYFADQASSNWRLNLNMIDLQIGQTFAVKRFFSLRGFAGLRTAWIHQSYKISYTGGQLSTNEKSPTIVNFKNDFWGLGLLAGLETQWGIAKGFSIFANAQVALLAGFFDLSSKETIPNTVNNNITDSFKSGKSMVDLGLGVRWDKTFCNDHYHIALQTGWEHCLFQNQFQWQSQDTPPFTTTDLSITGWTFNARFDF